MDVERNQPDVTTIRGRKSQRKKPAGNRDVSHRGVTLVMAAGFAAFLTLQYPQVGTPILVAVAVLTVLNQIVGRDKDPDQE